MQYEMTIRMSRRVRCSASSARQQKCPAVPSALSSAEQRYFALFLLFLDGFSLGINENANAQNASSALPYRVIA